MKISIRILLALLLLIIPAKYSFSELLVISESFIEARQLLNDGSTIGDTALILQGRDILLEIYQKEKSPKVLYFIAQSELELIRLGMAIEKSTLFDRYYDLSVSRAKQLMDIKPKWSEPYALLAILYGYKMAKNPVHAVTLGPRSYFLAEDAIKADKNNPRAWLVAGIVRLHMPTFAGGGVDAAIPLFRKAIELFERQQNSDLSQPNWGYIDALTWLGWAYEKDKQPKEALKIYKQALSLEPRAKWISSIFIEPLQKREGLL